VSDDPSDLARGAGRPPHQPTPRTRQTVQVMHAHGISHRIIAKVIECAPGTLRKYYHEELRDAHERVEASMGAAIVAAAQNGAWGAAKYWLQSHAKDARWRTPEHHRISGDPDGPPLRVALTDMTADEIKRELDDLREREAIAADARAVAAPLSKRSNGMEH
jgi:hypothetical protein